jgi:hypothetical protein
LFTVVDDQVDAFDVDAAAEQVGGDEESGAVGLEEVVVLDAFLLLELGVDADGVEELLPEQFGELLGPVDPVDEDDHLVEGQRVQQVGQLLKLLVLTTSRLTSLR